VVKAVIFDIGGVLVRTEEWDGRREWEERLGLGPMELHDLVFASEMGRQAQLGAITSQELWHWVGDQLGLDESGLSVMAAAFWAGDVLDEGLMALIRSLRPGVQTAIISNATDGLRASLRERYPIDDAFDLIVCSAEEKVMKPDPAIYLRTLDRLERRPEEAVFVDDNPENTAGARAVGMHAIHFRPAMDLAAELAKLGVGKAEEE
jgi:epoxide hydrolase-like predicted phosphatase